MSPGSLRHQVRLFEERIRLPREYSSNGPYRWVLIRETKRGRDFHVSIWSRDGTRVLGVNYTCYEEDAENIVLKRMAQYLKSLEF